MPFDKAANHVAKLCQILYVLVIAKELGFISGNSNINNGSYQEINSIMENAIINKHKEIIFPFCC